jgi:hypothetical protein
MSYVRSVFTSVNIGGCKDSFLFSVDPSLLYGNAYLNTLCGDALNKPADRKVYAVELTLRL